MKLWSRGYLGQESLIDKNFIEAGSFVQGLVKFAVCLVLLLHAAYIGESIEGKLSYNLAWMNTTHPLSVY